MSRLIIADPGLTGLLGQHLSCRAAVAGAAIRAGVPALVLAGRGFNGALISEGIQMRPVLGSAYQTAGRGGVVRRLVFGLAARLPGPLCAPAAMALRKRAKARAESASSIVLVWSCRSATRLLSDPANEDSSKSRASGGWGHGPQTPFLGKSGVRALQRIRKKHGVWGQ